MTADRPGRDLVVALAVLVALNVLTGAVLGGAVSAIAQVSVALVSVGVALRRGCSVEDLGLARRAIPAGLRLGAALSAVVVVGVVVIAVAPFSSGFLDDDRFVDISAWRVAYEVFVRIPIVTALTEEVLFRSVLLAVMTKLMSSAWAVAASSLCFGLWHVLVTLDDLGGNATTDSLSTAGRAGSVVGVVAVTSIAGAVFAWSRLRSGSIVAPWLLHTALNGSTFVAGYVVATA